MSILLNDITKQIKAGKNVSPKLNINIHFEQNKTIPKRMGNYVDTIEQPDMGPIIYSEGDIIDIPNNLTNICNLDNYYIFGVSHENHLLESIFYNIDNSFKFEEPTKKTEIVEEFKNLLKDANSKKAEMIFSNNFNNVYIDMCSTYFNINILCINCDDNSYSISKELNSSIETIIIVNIFNKYLPLLHLFGEKPSYSLCSTIIKYFNNK